MRAESSEKERVRQHVSVTWNGHRVYNRLLPGQPSDPVRSEAVEWMAVAVPAGCPLYDAAASSAVHEGGNTALAATGLHEGELTECGEVGRVNTPGVHLCIAGEVSKVCDATSGELGDPYVGRFLGTEPDEQSVTGLNDQLLGAPEVRVEMPHDAAPP